MKRHTYTSIQKGFAAIAALVSCSILISGNSVAAPTQGTLNSTSTGIVNITVDKPAQVRISALSDMSVAGGWHIGDGAVALNSTACIYSTSGNYSLVASGSGASSAFTISDGVDATALHTIAYTVKWNDAGVGALGAGGTDLTAAAAPASFANASTVSSTCLTGVDASGTTITAGSNAQVNIGFTDVDLIKLASGTFTGTLTLLIAPI